MGVIRRHLSTHDEINPELVFDIIQNHLDDFYRFRDEVDAWISE